MDGIFDKILPKLPAWMIVPIAIFWLFLLAWPVLKEIWFSVIPSYRAYTREQRRLELLKLYHEIEAHYSWPHGIVLDLAITNLTDKAPPFLNTGLPENTDPGTYPLLGRTFFVGLSCTF